MKKLTALATTLALVLFNGALARPAAAAASLPGTAEVLVGRGVNEVGGVFTVVICENVPNCPPGFFHYESASGFVYGGRLDCIHVDGDSSYVSGVVSYSNGPPVGLGIMQKYTDASDPATGARDTMAAFAYNPNGYVPAACDDPVVRAFLDAQPVLEVTSGGVTVQG